MKGIAQQPEACCATFEATMLACTPTNELPHLRTGVTCERKLCSALQSVLAARLQSSVT